MSYVITILLVAAILWALVANCVGKWYPKVRNVTVDVYVTSVIVLLVGILCTMLFGPITGPFLRGVHYTIRADALVDTVPRPVLEHVVFGNNTAGFYAEITSKGIQADKVGNFTTGTLHLVAHAISQLLAEEMDPDARDVVLRMVSTSEYARTPTFNAVLGNPRFRDVLEARMAQDQ